MAAWQFNVAFIVALALLVIFSLAPYAGLDDVAPNPVVVSGVGALLGYVFTRRERMTTKDE